MTEIIPAYPVMEHFYTLQGEGAFTGNAAYFIRLGGCDVGCVWCDVKESWPIDAHPKMTVSELVSYIKKENAQIAVITGGEPALHNLTALTQALKSAQCRTHIETSASSEITGEWDWVTISPKKFKSPLSSELKKADELKIIVFNKSDFEWAEDHAKLVSPKCKLYLQPEWDRQEQILPLIIEYIKKNPKWQLSLQTHKFLNIP